MGRNGLFDPLARRARRSIADNPSRSPLTRGEVPPLHCNPRLHDEILLDCAPSERVRRCLSPSQGSRHRLTISVIARTVRAQFLKHSVLLSQGGCHDRGFVRSTVRSCRMIGSPSAVSTTSISTIVAPQDFAAWKAGSVFSG